MPQRLPFRCLLIAAIYLGEASPPFPFLCSVLCALCCLLSAVCCLLPIIFFLRSSMFYSTLRELVSDTVLLL
jgi:hypothetical protein